jgi:hypothetical protein
VHPAGGRWSISPVRAWKAADLTSAAVATFQRDRLDEGPRPATVNRELEALRAAYRHAAKQAPAKFPGHLIPTIPMLTAHNVRMGHFTLAEVVALLEKIQTPDVRELHRVGVPHRNALR